MKRWIIAPVLFALCSVTAFGDEKKEPKTSKSTLFEIKSEVTEKTTNVLLSFNQDFVDAKLAFEAHGSFLQLKLPSTFVPKSGEFVDLKSPYFTKAVAFQSGSEEGAVRIFVKGKAEDYLKSTVADILGKKVIVTLDHQTLNGGDKVVALPDEKSEEKKDAAALTGFGGFDQSLKSKMAGVAIFCTVMLVALVLLFLARPFIRKRFKAKTQRSGTDMETLSIHPISPKQKLTLVKVGGEKILLAVSPESVSYIKTIEEKPSPSPLVQRVVQRQAAPQPAQRTVVTKRKAGNKQFNPTDATAAPRKQPAQTQAKTRKSPAERVLEEESNSRGVDLQLSGTRAVARKQDAPATAVDDIRKIIRQKLKQMPQIS